MKSNSVNYLVVGVFVIAMLAGTVVLIAALSGRTGPTDRYYTQYEEVTGIKFGTKVLFMGFPVGQVEDVTWDEESLEFKLQMSISTEWKGRIPEDSVAEVQTGGLLAAVVIDIKSGKSKSPLQPGGTLEGLENAGLLASVLGSDAASIIPTVSNLADQFSDFAVKANSFADKANNLADDQLTPMVANARRHLDDFGTRLDVFGTRLDKFGITGVETVTKLAAFAAELEQGIPGIREAAELTVRDLRDSAAQLKAILGPENSKKVAQILVYAEDATADVAAFTADERIDETLAHVKNASAHLDTLTGNAKTRLDDLLSETTVTKVRASLDNVSRAAKNVAQLSRDLRETRGKLDHFIETLDHVATENRPDVRDAVKDLRQTMDVVNHHIGTIAQNLEGTSRNMREFSRQIRQNPGALLGGKPPSDTAQY